MALLLVGAGIVGLAFGGISYTSVGELALDFPLVERAPVSLPVAVGVGLGAVALGGFLFLTRRFEHWAAARARPRWPR